MTQLVVNGKLTSELNRCWDRRFDSPREIHIAVETPAVKQITHGKFDGVLCVMTWRESAHVEIRVKIIAHFAIRRAYQLREFAEKTMRYRWRLLLVVLCCGTTHLPVYGQAVAENLDRSKMPAIAEKPHDPCSDEAVVKKKCFAVWTVPEEPKAGQAYGIVIRVTPPANQQSVKTLDLSGVVIGTDGYRQQFGHPKKDIPIKNGSATIEVRVPGAPKLVKDTIQVKCKRLNESAVLKLNFK